MSKPQHTSAPWSISTITDSDNCQRAAVIHETENGTETICICSGLNGTNPGIIAQSNARLIASAPEMFDALEEITNAHLVGMGKSAMVLRIELCLRAINKAKGLPVKEGHYLTPEIKRKWNTPKEN